MIQYYSTSTSYSNNINNITTKSIYYSYYP